MNFSVPGRKGAAEFWHWDSIRCRADKKQDGSNFVYVIIIFLCSYVANFLLNDPDEVGNKNIKTTSAKFLQQGRGRGARDYSDGKVCRHGRFGEESEMFPLLTIFTLDFIIIFCMTCPKGWRSVACKCS